MTHGVVFDLVKKLKITPETLSVLGDGSQFKPFVLASELSRYICEAASLPNGINILNISNNQPIRISRIAELVASKSGKNPQIQYSQAREGWKGDVPEYDLDCSAAVKSFGSLQFATSEEAISKAIDWEWESSIEANE
jgi:UDP-glucose 4-epimerase